MSKSILSADQVRSALDSYCADYGVVHNGFNGTTRLVNLCPKGSIGNDWQSFKIERQWGISDIGVLIASVGLTPEPIIETPETPESVKTIKTAKSVRVERFQNRTIKTVRESRIVQIVKAKKLSGVVIYRGPSMLDGKPIVGIVTFKTANDKTGDMAQLSILRDDIRPDHANQLGLDKSICGACPLAGISRKLEGRELLKSMENGGTGYTASGRDCYVMIHTAPLQIWTPDRTRLYPDATDASLRSGIRGRSIRLGAYGDPVVLPLGILTQCVNASNGHTGYTHQWRDDRSQAYRGLVMASVESEQDASLAHSMGWRTFRVRRDSDSVMPNEVACPASPEGGNRKQCATCKACSGMSREGQASVVIVGHGGLVATSNVNRHLDRLASISLN